MAEAVDELAARAQEAFTAQQDKKVMKKLKLSADCIPIDKIGDFFRSWKGLPTACPTAKAAQTCSTACPLLSSLACRTRISLSGCALCCPPRSLPLLASAPFLPSHRAMGCNPSFAEIAEATAMVDPDGEGVAR